MSDSSILQIDGSEGEGGGQILRTALSLSLICQKAFRIHHIRANRRPPGLRPQHLACIRGAEAISQSTSEGAEVDSSEVVFHPGPVTSGNYVIDVGTAGSTPLLFQCLFFPLALAGGGDLVLRGGTHVSHSPSYHYLVNIWRIALGAYGLRADFRLRYVGFYPKGGGEFEARILPRGPAPDCVDLPARGTLGQVQVTSMVANLPFHIAERQAHAAQRVLREKGIRSEVEHLPLPSSGSSGSALFIRAEFENTLAGFDALGERGKRAETVGEEAAQALADFMASAGAFDEHLADQLLLPAALLASGRLGKTSPGTTLFTTARVTGHLETNARLIEQFLPVRIEIDRTGRVFVSPRV